jgi:hypothetical protein
MHPARALWQLFEPFHAIVYFAPDKKEIYDAAGLKGGWMGYFASRAAAMGPVSAEVVTATFYNFHPARVARAIPDAWRLSSVDTVLAARLEVVDRTLLSLFGEEIVTSADVAEAAELGARAARSARPEGRPLFAAHAAVEPAAFPHVALWQAATMMREHRGDGHVSALVNEGVDGCEANVLMAAAGLVSRQEQRSFRGWSDVEWDAATDHLRERGWLNGSELTDEGRAVRERIESATDELAMPVLRGFEAGELERFSTIMLRLRERIEDLIPFPNPIGLPNSRPAALPSP